MPNHIEVDLESAWQSRDGVALWITVNGDRTQVHVDRSAVIAPNPNEHEEAMQTLMLFNIQADRMRRRIEYEAENGWSGPLPFMVRGSWNS